MKVNDLNRGVENVKTHETRFGNGSENNLKNVLSTVFEIIEKFEKSGKNDSKSGKDKIEVLKDFIRDMVKDEDQKQMIIAGGR